MSVSLPPGTRVRFGPEIFRIQRRGGVSRYVVELHRGLLERGIDSAIEAGLHRSEVLQGVTGVDGRDVDRLHPARLRQALTLVAGERRVRRSTRALAAGDVWHPTYFPRSLPDVPALAVTVYDMIHERFPEQVSGRDDTPARKAAACAAADVIFAISQATANDLVELGGIDPERIVVTPLGVRPVVPAAVPVPFGDDPYVVFVGDRKARYKNWWSLVDALAQGERALGLVCIGSPATEAETARLESRGLAGRVRFEQASDAQLVGWLAGSAGLVYPSLYEGFGLPPLEALAAGCPVVAATTGAIPEVVGSLAIMVEPTVEGIGDGLVALLANGEAVERQRREGPAFARRHQWSHTVDFTIEGYARLVG